MGFPIRISPDHSLLAASRSFSQLIASFFAFLRLGIHTHALSSLTIKSTTHIRPVPSPLPYGRGSVLGRHERYSKSLSLTCVLYARQYSVVKDLDCFSNQLSGQAQRTADLLLDLVGLGRVELPTSPLSGVRSSHLSYRPGWLLSQTWWSWSGSNRRPPECKSGALPAELQPLMSYQSSAISYQSNPPGTDSC